MPSAGDHGPAGGAAGGLAARVAAVTGSPPRRVVSAGGQHRWQHCRVTLATGEQAFAKVAATDLGGVFEAEAAGLRWLAAAGAVPVPRVLGAGPGALVVSWVDSEPASSRLYRCCDDGHSGVFVFTARRNLSAISLRHHGAPVA